MSEVQASSSTSSSPSGPDRLLPAHALTATDPRSAVKLRLGDTRHDDYEPVSVPTLLDRSVGGPRDLSTMELPTFLESNMPNTV